MWVKEERRRGRTNIYTSYTVKIIFLLSVHTWSKCLLIKCFQLAMITWRREVLKPLEQDGSQLAHSMIHVVDQQRDGSAVNISLLKEIIDSLVHLGANDAAPNGGSLVVYQETFEAQFLCSTMNYYRIWSTTFIASNPLVTYLIAVQDRIREEQIRGHWFLHYSTVESLKACCVDTLISKHTESIHEAFRCFLEREECDSMRHTYNVLSLVTNGLQPLRDIFMLYVRTQALKAIQDVVCDLTSTLR